MNNKYKILVIEDEANIVNLVSNLLQTNGYQVFSADSCKSGVMMFSSYSPDLVILDLGLPDADGMEFISFVRKSFSVPIIVLSARTDERDKVSALDAGANDYVTKPFGSAELVARVRSALRNSRYDVDDEHLYSGKFVLGNLIIDYESRRVFLSDEEIHFTQTEYNILALLSQHCGKVLTYQSIINSIWGYNDYGSRKKLQVNMANIRKKFGAIPGESFYVVNELGVGYRMSEN